MLKNILIEHKQKIEKHGLSIQLVGAEPDGSMPAYAYTIGLRNRGLPDLYIVGAISPSTLAYILNSVFDKWAEKGLFFGETSEIISDGLKVKILPINDDSKLVVGVNRAFYNEFPSTFNADSNALECQFAQILWPDESGNFPTDAGWNNKYIQPVYCSNTN